VATNPDVYTVDQAEEDIADTRGIVDTLGEVHTLSDGGVVPNTPGAGQVSHFVTAGIPQFVNPQGLQLNLVGSNGLAVVAPVVATAATPTNIATFAIPPGDCVPGAVYRLTTFGFGTTGSNGPSNVLTLDMTHGGVGGGSVALGSSLFGLSQAFRWFMQGNLVCITNGVGGTFFSYANITAHSTAGNILPTGVQAVGVAPGTSSAFVVDTTSTETFRLRAAWALTTGAPTLTAVASFGERVA
jgi:hypothetical protein